MDMKIKKEEIQPILKNNSEKELRNQIEQWKNYQDENKDKIRKMNDIPKIIIHKAVDDWVEEVQDNNRNIDTSNNKN